jgi:hypothetical protein
VKVAAEPRRTIVIPVPLSAARRSITVTIRSSDSDTAVGEATPVQPSRLRRQHSKYRRGYKPAQ